MISTSFSFVKWDTKNPSNIVAGALHRMAVDTQAMMIEKDPGNGLHNNKRMQRCLKQAADTLAAYLAQRIERFHSQQIPLSREGALLVIEKLRASQPKSKIKKLLDIVDKIDWTALEMSNVPHSGTKVFIKNEGYPGKDKPPRLIAFPQEGEKLLMSMAFYHVMHPLFSSPYCTKEIPEHQRPHTIERRLNELPNRYVADYTSFECVPDKLMMKLGEHRVLKQLVAPEYHFLFDWIERGGKLTARNGVTIRTTAVQYSGRYTTSLCNTIRNKLLLDSVALYLGLGLEEYRAVYEGDDSLSAWPAEITQEMISSALGRLGVAAEIMKVEEIGTAGYCSMYWNQNYELVCDPVKVLATFPFSCSQLSHSPQNTEGLLAAKAMSLAYRAPGCPIVSALVQRYIRPSGYMETRNEYERRWFREFSNIRRDKRKNATMNKLKVTFDRWDLVRKPTTEQRLMFYRIFNIPPVDQITAERNILYGDGLNQTVIDCLRGAESVLDVSLDDLQGIYYTMLFHAHRA